MNTGTSTTLLRGARLCLVSAALSALALVTSGAIRVYEAQLEPRIRIDLTPFQLSHGLAAVVGTLCLVVGLILLARSTRCAHPRSARLLALALIMEGVAFAVGFALAALAPTTRAWWTVLLHVPGTVLSMSLLAHGVARLLDASCVRLAWWTTGLLVAATLVAALAPWLGLSALAGSLGARVFALAGHALLLVLLGRLVSTSSAALAAEPARLHFSRAMMQALCVVALALGVAALGSAVYGMVETLPSYESAAAFMSSDGVASASGRVSDLDRRLYQGYRETLTMHATAALACGGLAVATGFVGALGGKSALGWGVVVLGVAGAAMGAMLFP